MLPTAKQMPKMEARFFPAIWLGKDTSTNENILGITNKVIRSRTIRKQVKPEKCNKMQQATPGCHQPHTDDNSNSINLHHATNSKDDGQTADSNRDTDNLTTR